jgi:hypothetical protein
MKVDETIALHHGIIRKLASYLHMSQDELIYLIHDSIESHDVFQQIADYTKMPFDEVKRIVTEASLLHSYLNCPLEDKKRTYKTVLLEILQYSWDEYNECKKQLDFYVILRGDVGDGTFFEE